MFKFNLRIVRISIGSLVYSTPSIDAYAQIIAPLCFTGAVIVCSVSTPAKQPVEHLHLNTLSVAGVDVIEHVRFRSDPMT